MAEIPFLIKDLALILMVAGIVTLIFKRLKQPLVLGYIMAGFLVSPHMPYTMSVVDETDIQTWADIGVIFTLFSLGLDFSFKKIVKMGASPIIATVVIVFCMMMLGISVGHGFGWGRMDCIFLGGMLAMSSTTIIYKAFDDMRLRTQKFASMVMSVLILDSERKQSRRRADACLYREDRLLPGRVVYRGHLRHSVVPAFGEETHQCRNPAHRFAGSVLRHGGTEHQGGVQQRLRILRHGQYTGRNH